MYETLAATGWMVRVAWEPETYIQDPLTNFWMPTVTVALSAAPVHEPVALTSMYPTEPLDSWTLCSVNAHSTPPYDEEQLASPSVDAMTKLPRIALWRRTFMSDLQIRMRRADLRGETIVLQWLLARKPPILGALYPLGPDPTLAGAGRVLPQLCAVGPRGDGDDCVAHAEDLVGAQGVVGGAQRHGQRDRLLARTDLLARVDIEHAHVFS